ncbi:hypothetical protein WA158_004626 [Blastocystis sp. Blastoise]
MECKDNSDYPPEINSRYIIKKEIGKGAYGTVFLASDKETQANVAIKRIEDIFRSQIDSKRTIREISILRQCNHKTISKLLDILSIKDIKNYKNLWVVMEYGGWDLLRILKNYRKINGWCSRYVKYIIYQLLCALNYLVAGSIVHRDLKPSNILMSDKCDLKLIDFGLARQIETLPSKQSTFTDKSRGIDISRDSSASDHVNRQLTQHVVTRWYRAPEVILCEKEYNSPVDIWSVGCIMGELLQTLEPDTTKPQPLFPGTTCFPLSSRRHERGHVDRLEYEFRQETHQLLKIFAVIGTPSDDEINQLDDGMFKDFLKDMAYIPPRDLHEMFPSTEEEGIRILTQMLQFDPSKRITAAEALKSSYFDSVRRKELEKTPNYPFSFPFEYSDVDSHGDLLEKNHDYYKSILSNEINQFFEDKGDERKSHHKTKPKCSIL